MEFVHSDGRHTACVITYLKDRDGADLGRQRPAKAMRVLSIAPRSARTSTASSPRLWDKTARVWTPFPDTQALISTAKR